MKEAQIIVIIVGVVSLVIVILSLLFPPRLVKAVLGSLWKRFVRVSKRVVMVSGKFDGPHEGHIDHVVKASHLGDYLIVVVQPDEAVKAVKGECQVPLWARLAYMEGLLLKYAIPGTVHVGLDTDGQSIKSLRFFKPDFFAKGGDRVPGNMPQEEIDTCKEIGCEIVYGVGDLLNASSKMTRDDASPGVCGPYRP